MEQIRSDNQTRDRDNQASDLAENLVMISQENFVEQFETNMINHPFRKHPFFARLNPDIDQEILKKWAIQAGRIDQAFVEILENMLQNPAIPTYAHDDVAENLDDELGNGDPQQEHFTLFKNVLQVLGISEDEYNNTPINSGTQKIIQELIDASNDSENPLRILSLMASEETICPREFPPFLDILRQKIGDVEALKYFDVHINADVKHAQDLTRICYEYCRENNIPIDEVYKYQEQDMQNNIRFYDDLMS